LYGRAGNLKAVAGRLSGQRFRKSQDIRRRELGRVFVAAETDAELRILMSSYLAGSDNSASRT
jgi:hypothetical protein